LNSCSASALDLLLILLSETERNHPTRYGVAFPVLHISPLLSALTTNRVGSTAAGSNVIAGL